MSECRSDKRVTDLQSRRLYPGFGRASHQILLQLPPAGQHGASKQNQVGHNDVSINRSELRCEWLGGSW